VSVVVLVVLVAELRVVSGGVSVVVLVVVDG